MEDRLGRWIQLRWLPADPILWAGPGWAMLCGVIASAGFESDRATLLRLLLTYFLADPLLGAVWSGAATLASVSAEDVEAAQEHAPRLPWLPYTLPGSPSAELRARVAHLLGGSEEVAPQAASIGGLTLGVLLTLLIGGLLGGAVWRLTVVSLLLALLGGLLPADAPGRLQRRLFFPLLSAWLLGHAALQPLTWPTLAFAGCYALAVYATGTLAFAPRWQPRVALVNSAQLLIILLLLLMRQPLLAGLAALLLWAQILLQLPLLSVGQHIPYWRWSSLYLLASMLLASWGVAQ